MKNIRWVSLFLTIAVLMLAFTASSSARPVLIWHGTQAHGKLHLWETRATPVQKYHLLHSFAAERRKAHAAVLPDVWQIPVAYWRAYWLTPPTVNLDAWSGGHPPCNGNWPFTFEDNSLRGTGIVGVLYWDACWSGINPDWTRNGGVVCMIEGHEFGHALALPHSTVGTWYDPADLMTPSYNGVRWPCRW